MIEKIRDKTESGNPQFGTNIDYVSSAVYEHWWKSTKELKRIVKEFNIDYDGFDKNKNISSRVKDVIKRVIYGSDSS